MPQASGSGKPRQFCGDSASRAFSAKRNDQCLDTAARVPSILGQQRAISRRPLILSRRANDLHGERADEAVQFIDVGAPAHAKAKVVQTDAILLEGATLHAWVPARRSRPPCVRRRSNKSCRCRSQVSCRKRQKLAVELAGGFQTRCDQKKYAQAGRNAGSKLPADKSYAFRPPHSAKNMEESRNWCCAGDTPREQICRPDRALVAGASMRGLRSRQRCGPECP